MPRAKRTKDAPCSNPDNVFCDALRSRCARAAVKYLKVSLNIQRSISTLTMPELEGMTEAITAEWVATVLEQIKMAPETVPAEIKDIFV